MHADRPGTRDVDLSLKVEDLVVRDRGHFVERQAARDPGIARDPAAWLGPENLVPEGTGVGDGRNECLARRLQETPPPLNGGRRANGVRAWLPQLASIRTRSTNSDRVIRFASPLGMSEPPGFWSSIAAAGTTAAGRWLP